MPETVPTVKEEEEEVTEPAGSVAKRVISHEIVLRVVAAVAETTSVATAERKVTWPRTVPSLRCAGGVARRDTRWTSVLSHPSATIVVKRDT